MTTHEIHLDPPSAVMGGRTPIRRAPIRPASEVRRTPSNGIVLPYDSRPVNPWKRTAGPRVLFSREPGLAAGDAIPFVHTYDDVEPFSAWTVCPGCGRWDLHWMETPNKAAPTIDHLVVQDGDSTEFRASEWTDDVRGWYVLSRHDERGVDVVRRCRNVDCQSRWPQHTNNKENHS